MALEALRDILQEILTEEFMPTPEKHCQVSKPSCEELATPESPARHNCAAFEPNTKIKANMARELSGMGLNAEAIGRVLRTNVDDIAEWVEIRDKGENADV